MKTKLPLLPLLLTAITLFSINAAQAHGTNWVTTLADSGAGSLRQVLLSAIDGDTVAFATNGTITLTSGELVITNNLSIIGPGATNLAISGNNSSRVFNIASSNVVVTMDDMTICNGKAANGINAPLYGSPGSGSDGGGIYNLGNLTLKRCILKNNTAGAGGTGYELGGDGGDGGTGGAVFNAGTLAVVSSTVASNAAGWGGNAGQTYGYSQDRGAGGHGGNGGGIYNTGILSIVSSTLAYNLTGVGGIGVGTQEMLPSGSGGNGGNGGGVYNAGTLSVGSSTLAFNRTGAGGLGANDADSGYENIAGGDGGHGGHGGGIYNIGTLSVASSTVAANSTGAGGKGGDASWTTTWFVGYDQGGDGGDGGDGGGIYSGGIVAIIHNTLVAANAVGARGLYGMQGYLLEGTTKIYGPSCGRDGSWGRDPDLSGSFTSQGYNLVGISGSSTGLVNGVNNNLVGTSVAPINPLLGPLTNNGGITMTMALLPGSPALDAGDDTLTGTDQRGVSRKSGFHVDIGAYEEITTVADVTTLASTAISFTTVTLNGTVNPKDLPTAAWFQWGTTTSYGNATSVTNLSAVSADLSVTRPLTGLTPGQTYHVQLVTSNSAGVVTGNDVTWTNLQPTTYAEAATLIDWTGVPADRRGPLDNSDGDTYNNFLTWALGGSFTLTDTNLAPITIEDVSSTQRQFRVTYTKAVPALTYQLIWSPDLAEWFSTGVSSEQLDSESGKHFQTYLNPVGTLKIFARVRVSETTTTINIASIPGITAPIALATPVTNITETAQYTGKVSWSPAHSQFQGATAYTATVTLTPKAGFTLSGVGQNFFTATGGTATNAANSGRVTIVYPATGNVVVNLLDIGSVIFMPLTGWKTTEYSYNSNGQYKVVDIIWYDELGDYFEGTFPDGMLGGVNIMIQAEPGFTLDGAGTFYHSGIGVTGFDYSGGLIGISFEVW